VQALKQTIRAVSFRNDHKAVDRWGGTGALEETGLALSELVIAVDDIGVESHAFNIHILHICKYIYVYIYIYMCIYIYICVNINKNVNTYICIKIYLY
jgi:hypothetical protein